MAAIAKRAEIAERRTKAIAMRAAGQRWDDIAETLGYASRGAAHTDVSRALTQRLKEQADQVDHLRAIETEHLDSMRRRMVTILDSADDEGAIKAAAQLVRIGERLAKLQGMDAPVKVESDGTVRYEIVGVDPAQLT